MPCVQTKLFKSNKSQAVRLPKAIVAHSWDDWFDSPGVSEDFMTERLQPVDQIRVESGTDHGLDKRINVVCP